MVTQILDPFFLQSPYKKNLTDAPLPATWAAGGSNMTRSPQFKTTVTQRSDGTIVIVIEPILAAPRGADRNLHSPHNVNQETVT